VGYRATTLSNPSQRCVNLPSLEEPTTYQQTVADIKIKSAYSIRCHERKAKGKSWETILENKLSSVLPRSVFVADFRLFAGHDYLQRHLDRIGFKDSPKHLLCGDSEEIGRDQFQRYQSVADATDSINNPGRYLKL
jgi:hypothetical protein